MQKRSAFDATALGAYDVSTRVEAYGPTGMLDRPSTSKGTPMNAKPNITSTASLIGDPARSVMLVTLLDGRARPAGELARAAGVTPQTASSHLAKLLVGGLVVVESEGRHRYYRLADSSVALAMESLAAVGPRGPVRRQSATRESQKLGFARCCYDHLAGRLGVAVTLSLERRAYIVPVSGKEYEVTSVGADWFAAFGLDSTVARPGRGGLARQCLDWTERQNHLAGPLGTRLMNLLCSKGWIRLAPSSRAVEVEPDGWVGLRTDFDIDGRDLRSVTAASASSP